MRPPPLVVPSAQQQQQVNQPGGGLAAQQALPFHQIHPKQMQMEPYSLCALGALVKSSALHKGNRVPLGCIRWDLNQQYTALDVNTKLKHP